MNNTESVWAEPLPENCPPKEAKNPNPNANVYYRLVDSYPPKEKDFYSNRKLSPDRKLRVSECQARALSIFNNNAECDKMRKFPTLKDKIIIKLILPKESGVIQQTGSPSHYSWWKLAKFNPLTFCTLFGEK